MDAPLISDEELLRQFFRGSQDSLAELARRYEPGLVGLATGLLAGRRDLAADVVQDCWVRVIRYGRSFDGRSTLRTWLYRMVVNRCHDVRKTWRDTSPPLEPAAAGQSLEDDDAVRLREAVEKLDDRVRLILLLCFHHGLTHEQAAAVLELPVGTLKSRMHAAMNELRAALSDRAQRSQS